MNYCIRGTGFYENNELAPDSISPSIKQRRRKPTPTHLNFKYYSAAAKRAKYELIR